MGRIEKAADFFYSSNSSKVVPLRITASFGMSGCDLDKEAFIELMKIIMESIDLKKDLKIFVNEL